MIGKKYRIDMNKKDTYPKVVYKEETKAYLQLHLEFEDGNNYLANVESINTKGIYNVLIVEKV